MLVLLAAWTSVTARSFRTSKWRSEDLPEPFFLLLSKKFCVSEVFADFMYACQERIKGKERASLIQPLFHR